MVILDSKISISQLMEMASHIYGDMVKAVVDVKKERLAIDAELHADLEKILLEEGSLQEDLWGFNLYPEMEGDDFIEYDSLINIRPRQNNSSRIVEDDSTREAIKNIVDKFISR